MSGRRTLVLCGDCWHPAETVRRGLAALPANGFEFEFSETGTAAAETLRNFSLVVLAKANLISPTDRREWLTADSPGGLADYVRRGNGLLIIHGGTSRYGGLPAMRALAGGAFLNHPPECDVTLEPQPAHELARGVDAFTVCDEHYAMAFEGSPADVFLNSRSEHGVQPAGWTRSAGNGRICVLTPGHNLAVWRHPSFQKLLLNTLRWTAKMS
jgi:type 1 glutamine amidotransferase